MFRGDTNQNPQAPQNFYVENMPPKIRVPPIDMNENSSWLRREKKWRGHFLFYFMCVEMTLSTNCTVASFRASPAVHVSVPDVLTVHAVMRRAALAKCISVERVDK